MNYKTVKTAKTYKLKEQSSHLFDFKFNFIVINKNTNLKYN